MGDKNLVSVETYAFGEGDASPVKASSNLANSVEICAWRNYGNVTVKVDKDKIVVQSQDGDGTVIEECTFKLDDLVCDGETDPDDVLDNSLKALDGVPAELQEAGMGENPNPLHNGEPEGQEAGGEEEGEGEVRREEGGGGPGGREA